MRFTEEAHARSRFAREPAAARRVAAFCTVRVLAADLDGEAPYIASELIEGPSLREIVERDGPLAGEALDPAQCASRVADGSVDAMVGDDLLIVGFGVRLRDVKVEIAGLRLTTERYGVALRSGDPVACRKINEVITSMYAAGTMERLLEEHLGRVGFRFETVRPRLETC
ncbi:transporter substrate-binding domain-containing protein [Streptosporangium sp. NPDC023825]|uniref:transporter substrate-binding domain-containing protein n=1 Tax=Streptosporangium sp. NPDC023825 TaxID=3154909 RepID=UPI00341B2D07